MQVIKTRPPYTLFISIIVFIISLAPIKAQDNINFTVSAPNKVYEGQAFDVVFSINSRGSKNFKAPSFKGLDVIYGPAQSQSSSFQFVNGASTQSFSLSFAYAIRATTVGEYEIGEASIEIGGKEYKTNATKLSVIASSNKSSNTQASSNKSNNRQNTVSKQHDVGAEDIDKEDLFIRTFASKQNPYKGEEIIITYRIYTAIPVEQYSIYKAPSNKGFWTEELNVTSKEPKHEVINGRRYMYADIRKVALFAQDAGILKVDPLEIEAIAQVEVQRTHTNTGSIFDIFNDPFFGNIERVKKTVKSNTLNINVKELPTVNRPKFFNGLVGRYTIKLDYPKTEILKANEAFSFKFSVKGSGNIELIQEPNIVFSPDFEVYEPKIVHNKTNTENGIGGSVSFEYIIIPRNSGVYKIQTFDYSFFNPIKKQYITTNIPEIVLNIAPGDASKAYTSSSGSMQQDITILNKDIEYIDTGKLQLKKRNHSFFLSFAWFSILISLIILFFVLLYLNKQNIKKQADIIGKKNKKALKEAAKCLKKAANFIKENKKDEFYIEISQALWGFLSNKLNIPTSKLSIDNVTSILKDKNINSILIDKFIQTLEHCEFERFAPHVDDLKSMEEMYKEALDIIYKIVKELK